MSEALKDKLRQGRPVAFSEEEAAFLVERLREALGTTLERPAAEIADDARLYDDLGVDSIDVFDVIDQLAEAFEVQVPLEELPESFLRGTERTTFREFAEGLLRYFREAPPGQG